MCTCHAPELGCWTSGPQGAKIIGCMPFHANMARGLLTQFATCRSTLWQKERIPTPTTLAWRICLDTFGAETCIFPFFAVGLVRGCGGWFRSLMTGTVQKCRCSLRLILMVLYRSDRRTQMHCVTTDGQRCGTIQFGARRRNGGRNGECFVLNGGVPLEFHLCLFRGFLRSCRHHCHRHPIKW